MSRVQKGGAIFKPITKARPRQGPGTASRQASTIVDTQTETASANPVIPHSQPSFSPPAPKVSSTANSSGFQPPPLASTTHPVVQAAVAAGSVNHGSAPLAPSSSKSASGNLIAPPSRPSGTPITIGTPRPPSQRAASNIQAPSLPPPQPALAVPASTSEPVASTSALPQRKESQPAPGEPETQPAEKKRTSRKRKESTAITEDGEDGASPTSSKGKSRRTRPRAPSVPPYDPTADPGEELDPTVVTMAALCSDTGQGRVSSKAVEILENHAIWKKQSREKRARMRALMEAKKYGKTEEEVDALEENGAASTPAADAPSTTNAATKALDADVDPSDPNLDYSQEFSTSRYNAQIRIGPNGETIIDEESLVVNREETDETANYTHVTESDNSKFVNSGTYSKRFRGSRWSAEETELFYDALTQYGENYELIAYVMPGRDRKSCKNKFKAEDKKNPARINYCLNNRTAPDIAYLSKMTGKDFSGPTPEIRAPERPAIPVPPVEDTSEEVRDPTPAPKRRRTKSNDDGLVIVGDASTTIPDFHS